MSLTLADWLSEYPGDSPALPASEEENTVPKAIFVNSVPLKEIVTLKNGLQISANDVFLVKGAKTDNGFAIFHAKPLDSSLKRLDY